MTSEMDALQQWQEEKRIYQAWGEALVKKVVRELEVRPDVSIQSFLKVPPIPRLKENDSFLAKVRRKISKGESLDTIDDRVGVRFVVLLTEQISLVEEVIRGFDVEISKDRDFEAEREIKPLEFSYQSIHLIVRPKKNESYEGVAVPAGTACEVQIRTLLQHAHSELTHDRIYKSKRVPPKGLHRSVARSMALIEATDDIFGDVAAKLDEAEAKVRSVATTLDEIYRDQVGEEPTAGKYNAEFIEDLLECGFDDAPNSIQERVVSLIGSKPYLLQKIRDYRLSRPLVYGISGVLFSYLLAVERLDKLKSCWPIDYGHLEDICFDLGISLED